ncbi:MAG: alpha/beta hydrolase [Bacteroidetes bacterium]|nr:alpha/beta hydrolase [Bacteroidota bacterium]
MLFYLVLFSSCSGPTNSGNSNNKYIFFLHNKFLELHSEKDSHPQFGKAEYSQIINYFQKDSFLVISEKRKPNTDAIAYAHHVAHQADSLLKAGIAPENITIIGTSKGGYIAQYVSTFMQNPKMNYVFIGCFMPGDTFDFPEIKPAGRILNIWETSDSFGNSMQHLKGRKNVPDYAEIKLNTRMGHGFLYKARKEWLKPASQWAKRQKS